MNFKPEIVVVVSNWANEDAGQYVYGVPLAWSCILTEWNSIK